MKNLLRSFGGLMLCGLSSVCICAESDVPEPAHVNVPEVAVRQQDVESVDGLMAALYEVLSGPAGQPRDWSRDRTLYLEDCRFIWWEDGDNGERHMVNLDHQGAVDLFNEAMVDKGYFVRETDRRTHISGNLAQVFSTYEASYTADGPVLERGINSLQLVNDGSRWWIMAIAFDETEVADADQGTKSIAAGRVIQPDEGEILDLCRMPGLSVNIKLDPASAEMPFSMGTGKLSGSPGKPAAHEQFDEVIFIHSGSGSVTIGTETFSASPGMTVYIPRGTDHGFISHGDTPLEFVWILSPPGYAEYLRQLDAESASECDVLSRARQ